MEIKKALPPKLAYRFRRWMLKFTNPQYTDIKLSEMKKHDVAISLYKKDIVRFDFGEDVSPDVKKMAVEWAKKKGLMSREASLAKSTKGQSYIVFAPKSVEIENPILIESYLLQ